MSIPAEGTKLFFRLPGAQTWDEVGDIVEVTPPGWSREAVDRTTLSSSAKRKRPGRIPDGGEVSLTVLYDPNDAIHIQLAAMANDFNIYEWRVQYADGMETPADDDFTGFLTEFAPGTAEDESDLQAELTIAVDGLANRNAGAN